MSVKYNVVQRGNPTKPTDPKKSYPSIAASGRKSLRELATEISRMSTVSNVDTMAVLEALLTIIPKELAAGNIVELGDFGSFWLKINAEGVDDPNAVRSGQVTNILPRFNAGREFKKALSEIKFEKA